MAWIPKLQRVVTPESRFMATPKRRRARFTQVRGQMLAVFLMLALLMQFIPSSLVTQASAVDSTTVKIFHPDFHSRLGAKILATVTTPNAARLRITLTNTAGYNVTLADVPSPTAADTHVATMNLRNLSAGTYTLTSNVLDANGTLVAQKIETFSRAITGAPKVGFDENNALYVNGQLTPVIGTWWGNFASWSPQYLPGLKTAGRITTAEVIDGARSSSTWATALDQAAAGGINAIGPTIAGQSDITNTVNTSKGKSALLSWMWMDEPEYSGVAASTVRGWTNTTHALDPHHPVMVNLVGPMFVNQGGSQATARTFTSDPINAQNPGVVDWYSTDYYPIAFSPNFGMTRQTAYDNYAQHLVNLRTYTKDLYPLKTFIEVGSMPELNSTVIPKPNEVWAQVWIAVAKGVRSISWFPVDSTGSVQSDPGIPAMETKAASYMARYAPMLAQADSKKVTRTHTAGSGRVDFIAKEYGGKMYIFAVNRDVSASATARFDISQFAPGSVTVYDENRTITPSGTSFTDTFVPYGVHVYEITGTGTTPVVTAPTGTMSVNSGAASTTSANVTVNSSVAGATDMRIDPGTGVFGAWTGYAASASAVLPAGEGTKNVRAEYRNTAGTLALSDSITLLAAPAPTPLPSGTMTLNQGGTYAKSTAVAVNSSVSGATQMRCDTGTGYSEWHPYTAAHTLTLPSGDGAKTVSAQYQNAGGTITLTDSITLDTTAPSGWFTINNGAAQTNVATVSIQNYITGATKMRFNTGSGFGAWATYATGTSLVLPAGGGTKNVSVEYSDDAGNIHTQATTIFLAVETPVGTASINGGATLTADTAVTLNSAVSGATEMRIDPGTGTFGSWTPYATTAAVTLPSGDGWKSVLAEYRNAAGGTISITNNIMLDATAPAGTMFVRLEGSTSTLTSATAISSVTGATQMRVDPGTGYLGAWTTYNPTLPITLPYVSGTRAVRVQYSDAAGNLLTLQSTVNLDQSTQLIVAPTGLQVTPLSGAIGLAWTASTGAGSYEVWRATSLTGTYRNIKTVYGTTYKDSSVRRGVRYYYKVCAVSASGIRSPFTAPSSTVVLSTKLK